MKFLVAAALAFGAIAGCDNLNCFDGGALEAKYNEGTDRALADNTARYDQGRAVGLSLTRADGEREGAQDGYAHGFAAGYDGFDGYHAGWNDAYDEGAYDGSHDSNACSAGEADGYAAGGADGYDDGYGEGYTDGFNVGVEVGSSDGVAACESSVARVAPKATTGAKATDADRMNVASTKAADDHAEDVDPEDARACYAQGYDDTADAGAYDRGLADGKRANPDYQAGYRATYDAAFAIGEVDGIDAGYRDGAIDGYDAGYADAAGVVYDGCYADGYDAGYADAGADGYDAGYADGYDGGYSAGWNDVTCE